MADAIYVAHIMHAQSNIAVRMKKIINNQWESYNFSIVNFCESAL